MGLGNRGTDWTKVSDKKPANGLSAERGSVLALDQKLDSIVAMLDGVLKKITGVQSGDADNLNDISSKFLEIYEAILKVNVDQGSIYRAVTGDVKQSIDGLGTEQRRSFTAIIEKLDRLASAAQTIQLEHRDESNIAQPAADIVPMFAEVTTHIARLFEVQNKALIAHIDGLKEQPASQAQQAAFVDAAVQHTTHDAEALSKLLEKVAAIDSRFSASARDGAQFMHVQQSIQKQLEALAAAVGNKEEFASLQQQIDVAKTSIERLLLSHEATLGRIESRMSVVTEDYRVEISRLRAEVARLTSQIASLDAHDEAQRVVWAAQLDAATAKLTQVEESARQQVAALVAEHERGVAGITASHAAALKRERRSERAHVLDVQRRWNEHREMRQKNELHKEMQKWGEMLKRNIGTLLEAYAASDVPDVRDVLAYAVYVEEFVRGKPRLGTELLDVCRLVRVQLRDMRDALRGLVPYEKAIPSASMYERMQELFVAAKSRKEDFDRVNGAYGAAKERAEQEARARVAAEEKAAAEAARAAQAEEEKRQAEVRAAEAAAHAAEASRQAQIAAEAAEAAQSRERATLETKLREETERIKINIRQQHANMYAVAQSLRVPQLAAYASQLRLDDVPARVPEEGVEEWYLTQNAAWVALFDRIIDPRGVFSEARFAEGRAFTAERRAHFLREHEDIEHDMQLRAGTQASLDALVGSTTADR